MIRILIAIPLGPKAMDQLNEIPEFEILDRTGAGVQPGLDEIRGVDALIFGGSPPLAEKILAAGGDLKLVIICSASRGRSGGVDKELAIRTRSEVRRIAAGRSCGGRAVAVLKEFFNV